MATSEEWTGVERRKASTGLREVQEELSSVRRVIEQVVPVLGKMMPRDEVEERMRVERRDRFKVTMALTAAIAILLSFVMISVVQINRIADIGRSNNRLLQEVECVVRVASEVPQAEQPAAYGRCLTLTDPSDKKERR